MCVPLLGDIMRTTEEKSQYMHDVYAQVYKQNIVISCVSAFQVMLTNIFWLIIDIYDQRIIKDHLHMDLDRSFVRLTMGVVVLYCCYMIYLKIKNNTNQILSRISLNLFCLLICLEVFVLCVNKNIVSAERYLYMNGISLSTLYIFIVIFIAMPKMSDSILVSVAVFLSVFLPKFLPGGQVYSLTQNMVLIFCVLVANFVFRHLMLLTAKQTINYSHERELYHTLTVQSIATIANTIDAKDFYTHGHSRRVGEYSRELAKRLGLGLKDQEEIYFAGLLHDVGKISTPREILNKPTRLTDEEFAIIKKHPVEGYNILKELKVIPNIAQAARWHHERVDGRGYPDGIRGNDLPLYAKIISVADSYDAMASDRPYRPNLSTEAIISELKKGQGSQFEPEIAEKMLDMIADGSAPVILENITREN